MNHNDLCLLIAVILFGVAGAIRLMARSVDGTVVAAGLAFFALAFLVSP